jgi:hypothetical protein
MIPPQFHAVRRVTNSFLMVAELNFPFIPFILTRRSACLCRSATVISRTGCFSPKVEIRWRK